MCYKASRILKFTSVCFLQGATIVDHEKHCACEFANQTLHMISDRECLSAFENISTDVANAARTSLVCSGRCRESVTNVLNNCQNQVWFYANFQPCVSVGLPIYRKQKQDNLISFVILVLVIVELRL